MSDNSIVETDLQRGEPRERGVPVEVEVSLGIITSIASAPIDYRRLAYKRQSRVHDILRGCRVSACLKVLKPLVEYVPIKKTETGKCHYSGLIVCGSVWMCPICSTRIAWNRAKELYKVNLKPFSLSMVTVTLQHSKTDHLEPLLNDLSLTWRKFKSGREYQGIIKKYGIKGTICGSEVRYGFHGWHPHKHTLYLSDIPLDQEFYDWASARWQRLLIQSGRFATLENGLKVTFQMSHDAKTYVTKLLDGETSQITETERWSITDELSRGYAKSGNSLHPFELLDMNTVDADLLFLEYAVSTEGHNALVYSRGLKKLLGMQEKTDQELSIEDEKNEDLLYLLSKDQWLKVLRYDLRYSILKQAENGQIQDIIESLELLPDVKK